MINFFDGLILSLFYASFVKLIISTINYSNFLDKEFYKKFQNNKISKIDSNNYIVQNVKNFLDNNNLNDNLILYVDGSLPSMVLFNIIYNITNSKINIVYFPDTNDPHYKIKKKVLNKFFKENKINFTHYFSCSPGKKYKHFFNWYNNTISSGVSSIILPNTYEDVTCEILDRLFNNDFCDYTPKVETCDNVNIYKPFYNVKLNELKKLSYNYDIYYFNEEIDLSRKKQFFKEYTEHLNYYYDDWDSNICNIFEKSLSFENIVDCKINEINNVNNNIEKYKNGFSITFNYKGIIPFNCFKKNILKLLKEYNFNVDEQIISTIYFNKDNKDNDKFINDCGIFYIYNKDKIIVFNKYKVQAYLDSANVILENVNTKKFKLSNNNINLHNLILNHKITLKQILDKKINFYICKPNKYIPQNIDISDSIIKIFDFKKFDMLDEYSLILVKL